MSIEPIRMWRTLAADETEPVWPDGIVVRGFRDVDAAAVHSLLEEAYSGWDDEYVSLDLDAWVALMMGDHQFDSSVWWLAEREGELAGCVLNWDSGWVKDIAVRTSERGRGVGEGLLRQSFGEFSRRGLPRVGLKVSPKNLGAIRLYEKLGFVADPAGVA